MRAGRLKTRRYRARRASGVWMGAAALLLLGLILGAWRAGWITLTLPAFVPARPAATLTPEDVKKEERTLTLPGQSWFALQLGVFADQAAAQSTAETYQGRGAAGYLALHQGSYRVLAAAYQARADAQQVQTRLRERHGVDAVIAEITRPEITLRLTGQAVQLTAIEDAWTALTQSALHLSALSQSLDEGGTDQAEAMDALRSERATMDALARQLDSLFDGGPAAARELSALLKDVSGALDGCLAASGKTQLGARIKYCQLLCVCRLAVWAEDLAR